MRRACPWLCIGLNPSALLSKNLCLKPCVRTCTQRRWQEEWSERGESSVKKGMKKKKKRKKKCVRNWQHQQQWCPEDSKMAKKTWRGTRITWGRGHTLPSCFTVQLRIVAVFFIFFFSLWCSHMCTTLASRVVSAWQSRCENAFAVTDTPYLICTRTRDSQKLCSLCGTGRVYSVSY